MLKIRWAKPSDVKAIVALFRYPEIRKYFGKNEYSYRYIREWVCHYPKIKAVAIVDKKIVGFISLYRYLFDYMTGYEHIGLFDIAVDPNQREKGVGSSLIKFAEKYFKRKGVKKNRNLRRKE